MVILLLIYKYTNYFYINMKNKSKIYLFSTQIVEIQTILYKTFFADFSNTQKLFYILMLYFVYCKKLLKFINNRNSGKSEFQN